MNSKLKRIMTEHPRPNTGVAGLSVVTDVTMGGSSMAAGAVGPRGGGSAPVVSTQTGGCGLGCLNLKFTGLTQNLGQL
jgi:hypothetical protein